MAHLRLLPSVTVRVGAPSEIVRDVQSGYGAFRSDVRQSHTNVARGLSAFGRATQAQVPGYRNWATQASSLTGRLQQFRGVSPSGALQGLNPLAGTPLSKYARSGTYAGVALSVAGGAAFAVVPEGGEGAEAVGSLSRVPATVYGEDAVRAGFFGHSAAEYQEYLKAGEESADYVGRLGPGTAEATGKLASYSTAAEGDATKAGASLASPEVTTARQSLSAAGWRAGSYLVKGAAIGGAVGLAGYGVGYGIYLAGSGIGAGLQNLIAPGTAQNPLTSGGGGGGTTSGTTGSTDILSELASSPLVIILAIGLGAYLLIRSSKSPSQSSGSSKSGS